MRSTMGHELLSGLALMNVHLDIPINIDEIVNDFPENTHIECSLRIFWMTSGYCCDILLLY